MNHPIVSAYSFKIPRKVFLLLTVFVDSLLIAFIGLLGPLVGTFALASLAAVIYCVFSPVGLILILTLISHISRLGTIDESLIRAVKWAVTIFLMLLTVFRLSSGDVRLNLKFGKIEHYFLLFVGWGAICSLFSMKPLDNLMETFRLLTLLLVYLLAKETIQKRTHVFLVLYAVLIAVVSASLYAFAQIWQAGPIRVTAFYGNPNSVGVFLSFAIPMLFIGYSVHRHLVLRMAFLGGLILGTFTIFFSWSRAAILCLAVQVIVYPIIEKKRNVLLVLLGVLLVIAASVATSPRSLTIVSHILRLEAGTTHRTVLWRYGIDALDKSPIFGLGFLMPSGEVVDRIMWGDIVEHELFGGATAYFGPHNIYLYLALAIGIPGLTFFLLLYVTLVRNQYRSWRTAPNEDERKLHAVMLSLVIGTMFYGFFETGGFLGNGSWANYFWIFLGLVAAVRNRNLLA